MLPPTTEATHSGREKPETMLTDAAIGVRMVMVPTEVPIAMERKQATMNSTGTASLAGMMSSRR